MRPLIPFFDHPKITIPLPFDLPLPTGPVSELTIYGFGIMVALGFLIGAKVAVNHANKSGMDGETVNKLVGWLVIGTFVGGHWGYALMYAPAEYFAEPVRFLHFWEGLSSFGGIVTCIVIVIWWVYKEKLPGWAFADSLAHGMGIGWALGRTGCTLAHDHPGAVTHFFLGRQGICLNNDPAMACHDLGMYEAIWAYSMFVVLRILDKKPRTAGVQAILLGLCYGPVRFGFDFLRPESSDPRWFYLTAGQWWALVLTVGCAALLWWRLATNKDEPRNVGLTPAEGEAEASA